MCPRKRRADAPGLVTKRERPMSHGRPTLVLREVRDRRGSLPLAEHNVARTAARAGQRDRDRPARDALRVCERRRAGYRGDPVRAVIAERRGESEGPVAHCGTPHAGRWVSASKPWRGCGALARERHRGAP